MSLRYKITYLTKFYVMVISGFIGEENVIRFLLDP